MRSLSRTIVVTAIGLLLVIAAIHVIDAPDSLAELPYKGVLFLLSSLGALVAAAGIWRGARWGWHLGMVVAAATFIGYVISRTAGLPGSDEVEAWLEPLGILSLLAEGAFLLLYGWVLSQNEHSRTMARS